MKEDYTKMLIKQIKRQLKIAFGIRSPSRDVLNQLEKWETMSKEERIQIIKQQQDLERKLFGETLQEIMEKVESD